MRDPNEHFNEAMDNEWDVADWYTCERDYGDEDYNPPDFED